jgi:peptidoglycan/xylan/chitin deacetylase (PgdA/CDA1 family)
MLQHSNAWLLRALHIGSLSLSLPTKSLAQVIKSGPQSFPGNAPTFDLCPVRKRPGYDQALVDYLIQHQIPSTFFMPGKWMAKHEEEVDHLLGIEFFEDGTHSEVHANLPMYNTDEQRTEILGPVKALHEHYAHEATLFRPPYGEYNDVTVDVVRALGLRFIQWNIESSVPDPSPLDRADSYASRDTREAWQQHRGHANGKGKHRPAR